MTTEDKDEIISRILKLQLEECEAIFNGHKPTIDDKFQTVRLELNILRCILYGHKSIYCKKNLGSK